MSALRITQSVSSAMRHGTTDDEHARALGCSHVRRKTLLWIHIMRAGVIENKQMWKSFSHWPNQMQKLEWQGPSMMQSIAALKLTEI